MPAPGLPRRDEPPVALDAETPVRYPMALYQQRISGTVLLRLFVDENGKVAPESTKVTGVERLPRAGLRRPRRGAQPALRARAPERHAGRHTVHSADPLPTSRPWRHHAVKPQHQDPYESVLDTIGWTPLIRLSRVGAGLPAPVYGKAEYANPGGSVKDRIGPRHHRGCRTERAAQAGGHRGGGHQREHRRRPCHRGGNQGLSLHFYPARQDVAGEGPAPPGLWRGGGDYPNLRCRRTIPRIT
jgi:hypothetical protein